ncbi:hypothetical protein, variant 1 [Aphanomyces invadans]|uniref:CHAT domain-containing protein n=1 Tax=Aphanomyces invadans TaxID=157072 RepID=A0A024U9H2_9STRA|nr:hypothetical protein, variant 1 [Aphanomyces invadans]ETW02532.1 hypothetical protein, variant 1 [Aphanomyces invadans]|eukprot:XP_008869137.1 hypothetical protein, variant 1 [Aphanomyces invadans]
MRRAHEPEPESVALAKYKRAHLDPSMETVSWVSWKPCPLYLELHRDCNLSLEHKEKLRVEGLYTIDVMEKAQGFVGLGRDDLANVFDPVWLRSVGRMICHFTLQLCPLGRPPALVITPWKGKVLINNQPTPNHLSTTLHAGDEVILVKKSNGTELKYVVVDRTKQPTMDATIGVVFAAPLVEFNPDGVKIALPELDFRNECLVLQKCLHEASRHKEPVLTSSGDRMFVRVPRPIHLLVHFATKQSFQAWSRGLQVLHFSGHGNDHCVYFEDNSGVAVPITPHEVAELLPTPLTLKLVFVASCASENIAQAFVALGVPHVVGTKCNTELEDKAAIAFTRRFYDALAQGTTVQKAFDVAKNFVASLPNTRNPDQVAHKFQLLPEGRRDLHGSAVLFPVDEVEKCLDLSDPFEWSQVSVVPMDESSQSPESLSPPSSPTPPLYDVFPNKLHYVRPGFGYRNLDMHHLVVAIHDHSLVTLTGPEGIGKSQLALATAWYLDLRQTKRDNVRFCRLGGILDCVFNETSMSCESLEHVWARHLEGIEASLGLALHPDMWPNIIMFDGCDPLHHHCLLRQYVEDFVCRLLAQKNDLHIVLTRWSTAPSCSRKS